VANEVGQYGPFAGLLLDISIALMILSCRCTTLRVGWLKLNEAVRLLKALYVRIVPGKQSLSALSNPFRRTAALSDQKITKFAPIAQQKWVKQKLFHFFSRGLLPMFYDTQKDRRCRNLMEPKMPDALPSHKNLVRSISWQINLRKFSELAFLPTFSDHIGNERT